MLIASEGVPLWSPVLLAEGRRMFLLHSRSSRKCKYFDGLRGVIRFSPGGDIVMATSDNNGKAWSSPQASSAAQWHERRARSTARNVCSILRTAPLLMTMKTLRGLIRRYKSPYNMPQIGVTT